MSIRLYSEALFPADGFIPQTLCDDDDPLDVLVLMQVWYQCINHWLTYLNIAIRIILPLYIITRKSLDMKYTIANCVSTNVRMESGTTLQSYGTEQD